jgi:hypothetical protein
MWKLGPGHAFDVSTLQVTPQQRDAISSLKQGTDAWLEARYGRLTASNFGAAAGHHLPGARRKLLEAMLWPEHHKLEGVAAQFAAYGTKHESVARDVYLADRLAHGNACVRVFETGLLVSLEHGWLGSSPDFVVEEYTDVHERPVGEVVNAHHAREPYSIVHSAGAPAFHKSLEGIPPQSFPAPTGVLTQGCGEIKCPATQLLYSRSGKHGKYGFPEYYYDQIQGIMAINHWPWCDTVVYTPRETQVIRFPANEEYWATQLFPALRAFYFDDFLPRVALRMQGRLKRGEIDAKMIIPASIFDLGVDMSLTTPVLNKETKKRKRV